MQCKVCWDGDFDWSDARSFGVEADFRFLAIRYVATYSPDHSILVTLQLRLGARLGISGNPERGEPVPGCNSSIIISSHERKDIRDPISYDNSNNITAHKHDRCVLFKPRSVRLHNFLKEFTFDPYTLLWVDTAKVHCLIRIVELLIVKIYLMVELSIYI
jgi:hypothetical protein